MKHKKRSHGGPPPWNPYLIQKMDPEEAAPLLWVPAILRTIPGRPTDPYKYGVAVGMDGDSSSSPLGTTYTWMTLTWLIQKQSTEWLPTAVSKVHVYGIDDYNYGIWLPSCDHSTFISKWQSLLSFLDDSGAREYGLSGNYLLDYCEDYLAGYDRDYN